jgi:hypothetical protein
MFESCRAHFFVLWAASDEMPPETATAQEAPTGAVTNFSDTQYTLMMSDLLCDSDTFALEPVGFSVPQPLAPPGNDVYYRQIDAIGGAGLPGD